MFNATILNRIELTPELLILQIKPDAPIPDFKPGQYVTLALPGASPRLAGLPPDKDPQPADKLIKRVYSIGSTPIQKDYLEFYLAVVPEGALTPRLAVPRVGDRVHVAPKITGTFTLDSVPSSENLVLVSTGTGIAPFVSMIRTPSTWTTDRQISVIHGVRFSKDFAYREELEELAKTKSNFRYLPIVSRTDPEWSGKTGRVQRLFETGEVALDPIRDHVFLCGNPAMIDDMEKLLTERGYETHSKKAPAGKLHLERYW